MEGESPPKKDLTLLTDLPLVDFSEPLPANDSLAPEQVVATETASVADASLAIEENEFVALDGLHAAEPLTLDGIEAQPQLSAVININERESPVLQNVELSQNIIVEAPPANLQQPVKSPEPSKNEQDFEEIKEFGDKLAIGEPHVEASPAFSLKVTSPTHFFSPKMIQAIEDAITSDDFGVRIEDITVQLSAGRLLIPQISEYAAVLLAQKLRDSVDHIEVDLAEAVFQSESMADITGIHESFAIPARHEEEVHDLDTEPQSADDVFTTNLSEIPGHKITRILALLSVSELISAEDAEKLEGAAFDQATHRLSEQLIANAYKLGAVGVIGVDYVLKPIEAFKDATGKITRGYRLLASGTAVRAVKITSHE